MSHIAGKACGMNVITPMKPSRTWINTFLFMFARAFPGKPAGLLGLSPIHFARWAHDPSRPMAGYRLHTRFGADIDQAVMSAVLKPLLSRHRRSDRHRWHAVPGPLQAQVRPHPGAIS